MFEGAGVGGWSGWKEKNEENEKMMVEDVF